jgi:hypothetical protein
VRNWVRFDRFPLLSSNGGLTQGATNCEQTFRDDRYIGFVFHPCALGSSCLKRRDEIARSECLSRQARAYIRDDVERVPLVVAARVARLWNLYAPRNDLSYGQIWARERTTAKLGMAMYALLALAAILGAVILRRRKVPVLPLLAMFVMASLTAAIAFGFSRYRLSAEPALIVLAAVGLDGLAVYAIRLFHDGKAGRRGQHAPT